MENIFFFIPNLVDTDVEGIEQALSMCEADTDEREHRISENVVIKKKGQGKCI